MATLSAVGSAGNVTLSGAAYAPGTPVTVSIAFSTTGRRYIEMVRVLADGAGAISATIPVPFAGTITLRAHQSNGTVDATSGSATVT